MPWGRRYGYYAALLLIVLHSLASQAFYQGQLSRILHTFSLMTGQVYETLPQCNVLLTV
jgi:hypothetical protein